MDKSWIDSSETFSAEYISGVAHFLEFAFTGKLSGSRIYCPCTKCKNRFTKKKDDVREHCLLYGFEKRYKNWRYHGEAYVPLHRNETNEHIISDNRDDIVGMVHEAVKIPSTNVDVGFSQTSNNEMNEETKNFFKLLQDAETELIPGCAKQTKLSFVVRLLQLKAHCGWTNKSIDLLLELLKDSFPDGVNIPANYYEAQKITNDLGFTYETIDACPNNCMLFRGKDDGLNRCEICNSSRYKDNGKKTAAKRMRYFPLKQRLQKLFMSSKTASLMRWHADERIDDGQFRHPADALAWKDFDIKNPLFASDARNIRMGLTSDGFNPFRMMNVSYSTWPVILIPYNLPPWLCMKQPNFILSILIDGPKSPGNKIDVYLQPLIEELKKLWEGVMTYDVSSSQMFNLRAALLWTISDLPAYAMLSGWGTKGAYACPNCGKDTQSKWLDNGHKYCYTCHRRFLPRGHKLRRDKISFDGTIEMEIKKVSMQNVGMLEELDRVATEYKKEDIKKRSRTKFEKENEEHVWKKRSIFFELPYWANNLIRHNLDVMHIEKNVCDNILWTIMGVKKKTKDNLKARRDLQKNNIRLPLHPVERDSGKFYLPPAPFTMGKKDKEIFCKVLKSVKAPDGYASNISRRIQIKEQTIGGLKSHDNHILLQQLLPLAIRRTLPKNVVDAIIELGNFFRKLCSKTNNKPDLEKLQDRIVLTLCHLEKIFPPSFFDIMEHLPIHLADEALKGGPVQFRWMYPVERYLLTLKKYVRNRAYPEGSIARGYLMDECMNFCSRYLNDVETKENRRPRNYDGDDSTGRVIGKGENFLMDQCTLLQVHRYILSNVDVVQQFRVMHVAEITREKPRARPWEVDRIHSQNFHEWFKLYVNNLQQTSNAQIPEDIRILANGPIRHGRRYKACVVRGFPFRTRSNDENKTTQNSGVMLKANTKSYSSTKDRRPHDGEVLYYGVLTDIIKVRYTNEIKFLMFKCDWVDPEKGVKQDEFKFTLVNFNHLLYKNNILSDEPFILSTQADQVWYVNDPLQVDWKVVVTMTPRDNFDVYSRSEAEPYSNQRLDDHVPTCDDDVGWIRQGIDGILVDENDDDIENSEENNDH